MAPIDNEIIYSVGQEEKLASLTSLPQLGKNLLPNVSPQKVTQRQSKPHSTKRLAGGALYISSLIWPKLATSAHSSQCRSRSLGSGSRVLVL